jgi:hypothetical protein
VLLRSDELSLSHRHPRGLGEELDSRGWAWVHAWAAYWSRQFTGQDSSYGLDPGAFTSFSGEIFRAPRSCAEKGYPSLVYFSEAAKGGHFAAWEEPEIFSKELPAAFKSLR